MAQKVNALWSMLLLIVASSAKAEDAKGWQWDATGSAILQDESGVGSYLLLDGNMENNDVVPYLTLPAFAPCQIDDEIAYQIHPMGMGKLNGKSLHWAYRCMGGGDLELMGQYAEDTMALVTAIRTQPRIDIQVGAYQFHARNGNGQEALDIAGQHLRQLQQDDDPGGVKH